MKHHFIPLTLGLAAGTGAAFWLPPFPAPSEEPDPPVPRKAPAVPETVNRPTPAAPPDSPPVALKDMTPEQRGAFYAKEIAELYELVMRDPEAAARRSRGRFDVWGPVNEVLVAAVSRDAQAALRGLEAEPKEHLRRQQRLDFIRAAALTDPALAREQLTKLDGVQERVFAIGAIAAGMARRDPAEAARWYLEHHEHPTGESFVAEVAAHYLAKDPKGALEWTMRLRDHDQRTAMRALIRA